MGVIYQFLIVHMLMANDNTISVIALFAGFLVLGILLKAIVFGARGKDAVPCVDFWTTFFTLQAVSYRKLL